MKFNRKEKKMRKKRKKGDFINFSSILFQIVLQKQQKCAIIVTERSLQKISSFSEGTVLSSHRYFIHYSSVFLSRQKRLCFFKKLIKHQICKPIFTN